MKSLLLKIAIFCVIVYEIESFSCSRNNPSDVSCYLHGSDCDCAKEKSHDARVERPVTKKKKKQKSGNQGYHIEVPLPNDEESDDNSQEVRTYNLKIHRPENCECSDW